MAKATLTKKRAYPANRPCQMPDTVWVMIRVTKVGFFPLTVKRSYTSAEGRRLSLAVRQDGQSTGLTADHLRGLSALCTDIAAGIPRCACASAETAGYAAQTSQHLAGPRSPTTLTDMLRWGRAPGTLHNPSHPQRPPVTLQEALAGTDAPMLKLWLCQGKHTVRQAQI